MKPSAPRRPQVTLKYAQTLDGRIATASARSRWVSGPQARAAAHALRAEHDAVLVGIGTVLADDPQLTVRLAVGRDPLRVIADSRLRTPPGASLFKSKRSGVLVAGVRDAPEDSRRALEAVGAEVTSVPAAQQGIDLHALLALLHDRGVRRLLVEGGAGLITSCLRLGLADEVVVFIAPKILGRGIDAVGDLAASDMSDAISISEMSVKREGDDIVVRGRITASERVDPAPK